MSGNEAAHTLALGSELCIRGIAERKGAFASVLEADGAVALDCASLERVDTAGVQLLCALATALRAAGRSLQWQGVGPVLRDASAALGLADVLRLPVSR